MGPALFALAGLLACTPESETPVSKFSISVQEIEFGEVPVSETAEQEVRFKCCDAGQSVDVTDVVLTTGEEKNWTFRLDTDMKVTQAHDVIIDIIFSPTEPGEVYEGRVEFQTDFRPEPVYVNMFGTGGLSEADGDHDGVTVGAGDCDDNDANRFPGNVETCDGVDNDCDDFVPEDELDKDNDKVRVCEGDCDDRDDKVYPGAPEICDGKDSDCDNIVQDNTDIDGDTVTICANPKDCDDSNAGIYPGAQEYCDGDDNDCDGIVDERDVDGDGHSPCGGGGDCDDTNPNAYPVVMATNGSSSGTGTDADPVDSLSRAVTLLDSVCRSVALLPGTYSNVSFNWSVQDLEIYGAGVDPDDVVVSPSAGNRVFDVAGTADMLVRNLTLANGSATGDGGAIRVTGGNLQLRDVVLRDNVAGSDGGAIAVNGGNLWLLTDVVFQDNASTDNGGALFISAGDVNDVSGTTKYIANTSGKSGGGIYSYHGTLTMDGSLVSGNTATDDGGGLFLNGTNSNILIERSDIWSNDATRGGGLVAFDMNGTVIRNNRILDNTADSGAGMRIGGGNNTFDFFNNTLAGNDALANGGCIDVEAPSQGVRLWANICAYTGGSNAIYIANTMQPDFQYTMVGRTLAGGPTNDYWGDTGNLNVNNIWNTDPDFAVYSNDNIPANDVFYFLTTSQAIDAGPTDVSWNDSDGSRNDLGYYGGPHAP